ncbi:Lrp/AsnC family transcriptional regulator [Oceanicoccus sp. KOV_DT_Chl]|uniref:Lrp/AsnC family transcriptional regulator n=1 Tax=Oceanicoccus sp. KOV_DT_Chl TaxID=1904639 RepID=UPI001F3D2B9D|nr:Lrp/AsnC family transcriptional regulator [Oceanicoccus sp. KOV_DT_Chl]
MSESTFKDSVAKRIASDSAITLDDIDYQIIALLRKDGRMPYRALAKLVGVTETTVRARVRRLEESDTMRVVAVTDYEAVGFDLMLAVGLQVEGRPADEVARDLAAFKEVFSACQVVGSLDIELLVVARDQQQLSEFLSGRLSKVAGVRRIFPALAMDVLKNQPNWVPFDSNAKRLPLSEAGDD